MCHLQRQILTLRVPDTWAVSRGHSHPPADPDFSNLVSYLLFYFC